MFRKDTIVDESKKYNSFYLYDESKILEDTNQLKTDFEGVEFLYSMKTNSNPMVVDTVFSQGFGADAASLTEAIHASECSVAKDKIQYSAPGKTIKDIEQAIDISLIIADSVNEVSRIQEVASKKGIVCEIGIRINPNYTFDNDKGISAKFGIDEEQVYENIELWKTFNNIKIVGIHVHTRSQELDPEKIKSHYIKTFNLAKEFQEKTSIRLKFINMGSGIGVPYREDDKSLNTKDLGSVISNLINEFKEDLSDTQIYIETGRFVVNRCGVYATKVLDKKVSRGKTFVILANTLNGFVRPAMEQIILKYAKDENPLECEPYFTSKGAFKFIPLTDEVEKEVITLAGNLCTSTDVVAHDILMPKLKEDDVIVMTNAGSYAAVLTPTQFSRQTPPQQLFVKSNGEVINTTK